MGVTLTNKPHAVYYGRSSVITFDYDNSTNDSFVSDYGNITNGSHSSTLDNTMYDDEYYEQNGGVYDFITDTGDKIIGTATLGIDGFWSTLTGLTSSLGSFPSFVADMFSFMPTCAEKRKCVRTEKAWSAERTPINGPC